MARGAQVLSAALRWSAVVFGSFGATAAMLELLASEIRPITHKSLPPSSTPVAVALWDPQDTLAGVAASPTAAFKTVTPELPDPRRLGESDSDATKESHPNPNQRFDSPDLKAAARGGGDVGGRFRYTGRLDRGDTGLSEQMTTGAADTRLFHQKTSSMQSSPETWNRVTKSGTADAKGEGRRKNGALAAQKAASSASAALNESRPAETAASSLIASSPANGRGSSSESVAARAAGAPAVAEGAAATESDRIGTYRDNVSSAERSAERSLGQLERTPPSSGGTRENGGVFGSEGQGVSAQGHASQEEPDGQAAAMAAVRAAAELKLRTRRRAQERYLAEMRSRVERYWEYPDDMRLAMEQGQAVVQVKIRTRDGALMDVKFVQRSAFGTFDKAVIKAIRSAEPFGPVPTALAEGELLTLSAPFEFDNPLIR